MKRIIYGESSIRKSLDAFEERYGMSSHAFYEAYKADDPSIGSIVGIDRRVWESLYVELLEDESPIHLPTDTGELQPV